jgi:GTP pyrophosphokinase
MGLGATAVVCALLHDTVEDTHITLEDVEDLFGPRVRLIIDGLTKIPEVFDENASIQAENFRKMILTISDDLRVVLIKLADRLHNMRTLGSMRADKQLKIASETKFLYAPLAHRLGLYSVKTELEDLSMIYCEPDVYKEIETKLKSTADVRNRFIRRFMSPIRETLLHEGYIIEIKARTKSISSIWRKVFLMKKCLMFLPFALSLKHPLNLRNQIVGVFIQLLLISINQVQNVYEIGFRPHVRTVTNRCIQQ